MKLEKTLVGEKVTLRKMEKMDIIDALEFAKHKRSVMRYLAANWGDNTPEQQVEVLKKWNKSEDWMPIAVSENCSGEHIANCHMSFTPRYKRCSVGILIGVTSAQGKGYGTEIVKIMRDYAFAEFGIERFELQVLPENERGIRCYEKCGLQKEGLLRGYYIKNGKPIDSYIMSIIKKEWKELTGNGKKLNYKQ